MNPKILIRFIACAIVLILLGVSYADTDLIKDYGWPAALGMSVLVAAVEFYFFFIYDTSHGSAPIQLVLRLADDRGGDGEDERMFKILHDRFKRFYRIPNEIRFSGFDCTDSFIWFYFRGPSGAATEREILSQLSGFKIHEGSYFLSQATQDTAPPSDGPVTFLTPTPASP